MGFWDSELYSQMNSMASALNVTCGVTEMQRCYKYWQRDNSLLLEYSGKISKKVNSELGPLGTLQENKMKKNI